MSPEMPKKRKGPKRTKSARGALLAALTAYGLVTAEPAESKGHPPSTPIPIGRSSSAEEIDAAERQQVEHMMAIREQKIRKDADDFITVADKFERLFVEAERYITTVTGISTLEGLSKEALLAARESLVRAATQGNPSEQAHLSEAFLDFRNASSFLAEFVQLHGSEKSAAQLLAEYPVLIDPFGSLQNIKQAQQNYNFFTHLKQLIGSETQDADLLVHDIPGSLPHGRMIAALGLVIIAEHIDAIDTQPAKPKENTPPLPDTKSINTYEEGEPT